MISTLFCGGGLMSWISKQCLVHLSLMYKPLHWGQHGNQIEMTVTNKPFTALASTIFYYSSPSVWCSVGAKLPSTLHLETEFSNMKKL